MPLNLLQIIPQLQTGGAERTTLEIAEAVTKDGGKAFVFTNGGRMVAELEASGANVIIGDAKSKNPFVILFVNTIKLCKIIKSEKIQIVHARSRAPAISAYLAAKLCSIPLVTTYHGIYNAKNPIKRFYNGIMTKGARIIANSNYTKNHLVKAHNIAPDSVDVIYRGVDISRFDETIINAARKNEILNRWKINPSPRPKILLPARLTLWKGQKTLLEAASLLAQKGIEADYVLAGEDQGRIQYTQELRDLIHKYNLTDMVHLVGHENDIPAAISVCDIIVTPSIEPEAFGRTAAEAQFMAKPVIASNIGGAKETILAGETGFLIEPGDYNQLANHIEALIKMGAKGRATIGQKGQIRARELFQTKTLQQKTLQLYYELLNETQLSEKR